MTHVSKLDKPTIRKMYPPEVDGHALEHSKAELFCKENLPR